MNFEACVSPEHWGRAQQATVSTGMNAAATYERVRACCVFYQSYVRPVLRGLLKKTPRDEVFILLSTRIIALLNSMRTLDSVAHVQSITAAGRTLFELGLDVALIHADRTAVAVERFRAFTDVERMNAARKTLDFYATRPVPRSMGPTLETMRLAWSDTARIETLVARIKELWGTTKKGTPCWPTHWSARDARTRSTDLGGPWADRYAATYYKFSWQVHGGGVGTAGLSPDAFHFFNSEAHTLATDVVLDSWRTLGAELKLAQAIDSWEGRLEFLDGVAGQKLADLRLVSLGDAPRFIYLTKEESEADVQPGPP